MDALRPEMMSRRAGLLTLRNLALLVACDGGNRGGGDLPDGHLRSYFQTNFSVIMQDAETDEGAIPSTGRTYHGSFKLCDTDAVAGRVIRMRSSSSRANTTLSNTD